MSRCSAPGKIILFGEHAVVFGKPALALAIDLRIVSDVQPSDEFTVNGHPMKKRHHAYISASLDEAWGGPPVSVRTISAIPSGSGLGSSAAVTVSCVGGLLAAKDQFSPELVARKAFEVELTVQGRASPTDTSTSAHGQGVLISPERLDGLLWKIEKGGSTWNIHHRDVMGLTFVIGYTGIHAATGPLVANVKKLVDVEPSAARSIDRIGEIVMDGADAIKTRDKKRLGSLMRENHELLNGLGVGHEALDKLVSACQETAYGAKLTGAGGGGSMVALTDDPKVTSEAIRKAGGEPITVRVGAQGVRVEKR